MSEKLKATMLNLVDDERKRIEGRMSEYAEILAQATTPEGYVLTIMVEGVDNQDTQGTKRLIDDLSKVGLVLTDTHWTHRNAQLVAHATPLGSQIVEELKQGK